MFDCLLHSFLSTFLFRLPSLSPWIYKCTRYACLKIYTHISHAILYVSIWLFVCEFAPHIISVELISRLTPMPKIQVTSFLGPMFQSSVLNVSLTCARPNTSLKINVIISQKDLWTKFPGQEMEKVWEHWSHLNLMLRYII